MAECVDDTNLNELGAPNEPIKAEIILYESEGLSVPVEVRYMDETFWLSQKEMAELFDADRTVITKHLKNIFSEGELEENSTSAKIALVQTEGNRQVKREVTLYNLDAIIAVGYRVNSLRATRFRQWTTATLKEYIQKGFVLNDDLLKNGTPFGKDYFDELLVRIRDIRASERRVWQKITDIFQECSFDYDKNSQTAKNFFATVQNKMHFAATGHTAAELVFERADATQPNMGLTSWKGGPEGRIHSSDAVVAKNYLSEDEIETLNRLVTMFLDDAELRARDHVLQSMEDCAQALDGFLQYNRRSVLEHKGIRSAAQAKKKASAEFAKFQKIQDATYKNDFEKHLESAGLK